MIRRGYLKLFLLILILFRAIPGDSQNANKLLDSTLNLNGTQKQILILNSWGTGLPIPDETKQGIYNALQAGGMSMNDIFFEDLDLVRSSSSQHRFNLAFLLLNKFKHKQIGIVILIGSQAIEFVANEAKDLCQNSAIIALISPNVNSLENDPRDIMYLPWRVDPEGSVKLALTLFPKTKHIFIITGAKDGILPFIEEAKRDLLPWENKLDIEYSNRMSYEEMVQRTSSLTNESVVLYSTFFTDRLNRSYIPAEVVSEVCKVSKVPVFATLEHYLELGIVGGALLETERLGRQAGNIALEYLSGKIVLEEHVTIFDTRIRTMLNWKELSRFEYSQGSIPKDCIVFGKSPTLWEQNKQVVIIVLGAFIILSFLIITLVFWNRRINKIRNAALESEQQLKRIANNFVNGMLYQVAMLDENKRKFTYLSDVVKELYGCTPEEAMEDPDLIYSRLHPEDINLLIEKEKEALRNMTVFQTESRVINQDGSIRWVYYMSKPRDINGVIYWDGIEVDITERKKNEQVLLESKERAEESDRLKSAFLANMSHEIRTPMNGILGFTELLREPDLNGQEKDKYIDIITKSGERMLNTVNDIIDISKIDAGQVELVKAVVDLNNELESLFTFFKPEANAKGLELILNIDFDEDKNYLETDEGKLNSILTNLIKNAIKYTETGSIEIVCTKKDDIFQCFVRDTGIGIKKESLESVFNRFEQASDDVRHTSHGSGLGLAITKSYVELLGGEIWLESELGKGSTFYFTLPSLSHSIH